MGVIGTMVAVLFVCPVVACTVGVSFLRSLLGVAAIGFFRRKPFSYYVTETE